MHRSASAGRLSGEMSSHRAGSGVRDRPRSNITDDAFLRLTAACTPLCLATVAVTLTTAHLSTFLIGRGLPRYPLHVVPAIVVRLAYAPADPTGAWAPYNSGAPVPGPLPFWTVWALLALPAAAVAITLTRKIVAGDRKGARWASTRDLRALHVRRSSARVVLGRHAGRWVATEPAHSTIVFGPTQSGKTSCIAIPAILRTSGSLVATSVKADLLEHTLDHRSDHGDVFVFDPMGSLGDRWPTHTWSPLAPAVDWAGARRVAEHLVHTANPHGDAGPGAMDHWYGAAATALGPLLHAAAVDRGRTMADVIRWIKRQDLTEPAQVLTARQATVALDELASLAAHDPKIRSSVFTTLEVLLAAFTHPKVLQATRHSQIDPDALVNIDRPATLYLVAAAHDQQLLRPVITALVAEIFNAAETRVTRTGAPVRLAAVLDEITNTAPIPALPRLTATGAANGIRLLVAAQDLAQLQGRYGQAANTILNNCRAKLFLPGLADPATLDLASRYTGTVRVDEGGSRPLLAADELRMLPRGRALLIYDRLPPVIVRLRPWRRH